MNHRILAVDDDSESLLATSLALQGWGYSVDIASNGSSALELIKRAPVAYSLALLDYGMPDMTGAELTAEIRKITKQPIILALSGDESREALKATLKAGAADFIEKGLDPETLRDLIARYINEFEETRVSAPPSTATTRSGLIGSIGMVGDSEHLASVAQKVLRYQSKVEPVLILGESGTGKELVAKAIHNGNVDRFYPINCASYSGSSHLLEAELFGYEKGAFTGAVQRKVGVFELAKNGTVFLDELHHLPLEAQGKLLRALQEKRIRRLGGAEEIPVNFRLVTAAKPEIVSHTKERRFLLDLYYRVNVLSIELLPLRERTADIKPLILKSVDRFNKTYGSHRIIQARALQLFEAQPWYGNARELESTVTRLLADTDAEVIGAEDLPDNFTARASAPLAWGELEERHEQEKREYITAVIGNAPSVTVAAQKIGVSRTTLASVMKRLGITK